MSFLIGELVAAVRADPAQFRRDMATVRREGDQSARQVNRSLDSIGSKLTRLGFLAKAAFSSAIVVGARQAVREFALLEGATAKFNQVFGQHTRDMQDWVEQTRQTVPLARREIIQYGAALQDLLVPSGVARDAAAEMTQEWFHLAAALAALNDVPITSTLEAIQSLIAGQTRPMRNYGVTIRETMVQQTALEEGLIKTGQAMTDTARQQALLILAYRQSQDALDGYEDQLGTTLMMEQELGATFRDKATELGQILQPAYNRIITTLIDVLNSTSDLKTEFEGLRVLITELPGPIRTLINSLDDYIEAIRWIERNSPIGTLRELSGWFRNNLSTIGQASQTLQGFREEMVRFTQASIPDDVPDDVLETIIDWNSKAAETVKKMADIKRGIENIPPVYDHIFPTERLLTDLEVAEQSVANIVGLTEDIDTSEFFDAGTIGAIRNELYELEQQLIRTTDEDRIRDLNQRIKELQEEIERLTGLGVEDKIDEMSDRMRLFTRTAADGLQQVLFQARSVQDAFDGIIRQLGSRALLAGLASLFGGSAVSFSGAFFGGLRSFDGGGFTGSGARTGGLDGKGGFLAMMHPNESVIDHTKNMGLNNVQKIHVHVTGEFQDRGDALRAVVAEQTRVIERLQ